jgi:DNA-binding response OmpR family regulator
MSGAGTAWVVEDDPKIGDVLEYALRAEGYGVRVMRSGREVLESAARGFPDVILLDVGLPDIDGFEVCRRVRRSSDVPVIFLTSRSDEINRVVGLEIGGDDYVAKPFSPREVLARIKAVRRRAGGSAGAAADPRAGVLAIGPLEIDVERFRVALGGREVALTRQEFRLVELLARHPGRVFTREQILDVAWEEGGAVTDRTIDAHVKQLRRKFAGLDLIETVRGIGYRAREDPGRG